MKRPCRRLTHRWATQTGGKFYELSPLTHSFLHVYVEIVILFILDSIMYRD